VNYISLLLYCVFFSIKSIACLEICPSVLIFNHISSPLPSLSNLVCKSSNVALFVLLSWIVVTPKDYLWDYHVLKFSIMSLALVKKNIQNIGLTILSCSSISAMA